MSAGEEPVEDREVCTDGEPHDWIRMHHGEWSVCEKCGGGDY